MISLVSNTIIHKYRFKRAVRAVKFSPNGKHFAVCKENNGNFLQKLISLQVLMWINCLVVFIFKAPGQYSGEYNSFSMERVFHGSYDETTCLEWSTDSNILAVGSKDMSTKLFTLGK